MGWSSSSRRSVRGKGTVVRDVVVGEKFETTGVTFSQKRFEITERKKLSIIILQLSGPLTVSISQKLRLFRELLQKVIDVLPPEILPF